MMTKEEIDKIKHFTPWNYVAQLCDYATQLQSRVEDLEDDSTALRSLNRLQGERITKLQAENAKLWMWLQRLTGCAEKIYHPMNTENSRVIVRELQTVTADALEFLDATAPQQAADEGK